MRLKQFKIKNFRSYKEEVVVSFGNMTAFVGKNDVGKSTILEAIDIFINEKEATVKYEKEDKNIDCRDEDTVFTAIFDELPQEILIDATNVTTLQNEHLLNESGDLEIIKKYGSSSFKVYLNAFYPTNPSCAQLHQKKNTDLKKIARELEVDCENCSCNAVLRKSIWSCFENLQLQMTEIEINSKDSESKAIWEGIQKAMPCYSLFQADRKNSDGDDVVQDPLKEAVKDLLKKDEIKSTLSQVAEQIKEALTDVSARTLAKLREMDPAIAESLEPSIPGVEELKWADVFKNISITGDQIPVNKRGSGVKRLILLNFFRAQAERRASDKKANNVIYAIEEPETSQHTENQKKMINALRAIASQNKKQVILTTHSPQVVKKLEKDQIRLVLNTDDGKVVQENIEYSLPWASLNEINYRAFGEISEEFHDELYGCLHIKANEEKNRDISEIACSNWLQEKGCSVSPNNWIRSSGQEDACTIQYYIRNFVHHPENRRNTKYSDIELRRSIEEMIRLLD